MNRRHQYSVTAIVDSWRKDRSKGYAKRISEEVGIPISIVYNVIHQHRKRRANYRNNNNNVSSKKRYNLVSVFFVRMEDNYAS